MADEASGAIGSTGDTGGAPEGNAGAEPASIPTARDIVDAGNKPLEAPAPATQDDWEKRLSTLARLETGMRDKELSLQEKVRDLEEKYNGSNTELEKYRTEDKEFRNKLKDNPNAIFDRYGNEVNFDSMVQRNLEGDDYKPKANPEIGRLEKQIEEMKSQRVKEKEDFDKQETERKKAAHDAQVDAYKNQVTQEITKGDYPHVHAVPGANDLVWQVIEQTFKDSKGETVLAPQEAAKKVEDYLTGHFQKQGFVRQGQPSGQPGQAPEQRNTNESEIVGGDYRRMTRTLTQDHAAPASSSNQEAKRKRYENDDEALARAAARLTFS